MYGEHPNGGMAEVDSRNVEFLEEEFPSIGEIKKDLALYELLLDDQLSLGDGEDLNTHRVTKNSTILLSRRDDELLVTQENQPDNEVRPHSPIYEYEVSALLQDSRSDTLLRILYLLEIETGVPQWDKPVQVLYSGRVSEEEFIDDISNRKGDILVHFFKDIRV